MSAYTYSNYNKKELFKTYLESYLASKNIKIYRGNMLHCILGTHKDTHPSMHLFVGDDGKPRLTCHACGKTIDIFDAVRYLEGIQYFKDQYDFLNLWINNNPEQPNSIELNRPISKTYAPKDRLSKLQITDYLNSCNPSLGYEKWKNRGLNEPTIDMFRLTYNERDDALVIPISNYGYIRRFLNASFNDEKYQRSRGLSECLTSIQFDPNLPIIVTEGEVDGLSVIEGNYPNMWAIGGATKVSKWIKEIHKINPNMILAFDNDKQGIEAYHTAFRICQNENWILPLNFWDNLLTDMTIHVKDLNELLCKHRDIFKDTLSAFKTCFGG